MQRRTFLLSTLAAPGLSIVGPGAAAMQPADAPAAVPPAPDPTLDASDEPAMRWRDVSEWGVEGRPFDDTDAYFDRLPGRAEAIVRPEVWELSRRTAGMAVRFETNATRLDIECELLRDALAMPHMPATGVSGLDLYCKQAGRWRWVAVFQPRDNPMRGTLVDRLAPGNREYLLYLPLYNGVLSLKLGVSDDATFTPLPPRDDKPLLFYGTSITQGACASRPGMAFVSQLGRRLDRPVLNFGFSGQGKMETDVAALLAELDPAVFVLDCMPNTPAEHVEQRSYDVVQRWRAIHPDTPIVMVESRSWSSANLVAGRETIHQAKRAAMRRTHERLRREGVAGLFYVRGEGLLGDDHEATTDGSHPSDLGMVRYADALEPVLREALDL